VQATVQDESPGSEALQTEIADAGNTDVALTNDGAPDAMQSDAARGSVQANPAVTARATAIDEQSDCSQLPHVAAAAAEPVQGINPVESVPDQVNDAVAIPLCSSAPGRTPLGSLPCVSRTLRVTFLSSICAAFLITNTPQADAQATRDDDELDEDEDEYYTSDPIWQYIRARTIASNIAHDIVEGVLQIIGAHNTGLQCAETSTSC
jgi:hypothetical protein